MEGPHYAKAKRTTKLLCKQVRETFTIEVAFELSFEASSQWRWRRKGNALQVEGQHAEAQEAWKSV